MVTRVANRDVPLMANRGIIVEGYGNMSVERPYWSGYLPYKVEKVYFARKHRISTVIYSYSTPIAWYDAEFNVWVVPFVKYSVTTAKHQGYLWQLGSENIIHIPYDCGEEEYFRYVSRKMEFTKNGTKPGKNWSLD